MTILFRIICKGSSDPEKTKDFDDENEEFYLNGGEEQIQSIKVQFYLL
jgi:hypothetical protein